MNDKERTDYFRKKLDTMKRAADDSLSDLTSNGNTENKEEKKSTALQRFFQTAFAFLAFYGTQYIILSKYVSPNLTLNFFEAGVIFLCLTSILARRS